MLQWLNDAVAPHYFGTANCAETHCLRKTFFEVFGMKFLVHFLLRLSPDIPPPQSCIVFTEINISYLNWQLLSWADINVYLSSAWVNLIGCRSPKVSCFNVCERDCNIAWSEINKSLIFRKARYLWRKRQCIARNNRHENYVTVGYR